MQKILKATQEETAASKVLAGRAHELTEEMKKDSLSMKTIAILTMFFLPGTSFAVSPLNKKTSPWLVHSTDACQALLAMPFFTQNPWLDKVSTFWVWVVLTVPSTGLAFVFYLYWKRRGKRCPKQEVEARRYWNERSRWWELIYVFRQDINLVKTVIWCNNWCAATLENHIYSAF